MRQVEVNQSLFDHILGMSCIENYLLYVLAARHYDHRFLYARSFVSFFDVASAFCEEAISYAYFNKIPRLQDTARQRGLISLSVVQDLDQGVSRFDYCCAFISSDYVKERYGRELWRGDHYILLCERTSDGWICLNDTPRDVIEIGTGELHRAYGGQAICFNILAGVENELKAEFLRELRDDIARQPRTFEFTIGDLETARDMLGVLRITRKRIREYCSIYVDVDFMSDELAELDRIYAALEYMRLRGRSDFERINRMLEQLQVQDIQMIDELNLRMEGF